MANTHGLQIAVPHDAVSGARRRHRRWRIGRLVCGLAAGTGLMAAASGGASAQAPDNNPNLAVRCGLKVMLVLDESQSIGPGTGGFNATDDVRNAATGFVTALEGTGSPLAITAFHSYGRSGPPETETGAGYSEITHANAGMFTDWINNEPGTSGYNPPLTVSTGTPSGTTNWQDAFNQVRRTPNGPPNLVVFVTDGDPNTVGDPNSPDAGNRYGTGRPFYIGNTEPDRRDATIPAVAVADQLKAEGVRIFGIGVGPAVDNTASEGRLQQVTGVNEGTNPISDDYTLVHKFEDLRAELARVVVSLCGSRLIIHKHVANVHGGPWKAGEDWKFTARLTSPGHTWLEPDAGGHDRASLSTGSDGSAEFLWRLPEADTTAQLGIIKETVKPGLHFVQARCETHTVDGHLIHQITVPTLPIPGTSLGREQYRTCSVYNAPEKPGGGGGEDATVEEPGAHAPYQPGTHTPYQPAAHAPHLVVRKTMPRRARVGDRVPITIVAHNAGKGAATDVVIRETSPRGLRIVHVANHGKLHGHTAVWHLGRLAPGAKRKVHATALATRRGLHLNTAVADARNADPGFDSRRVREARARRARRPVFTG